MRTVTATRYVTPLREGGSLPALMEADDDGLYVVKFSGAGQGPKALVAELVGGEIGRALGLPVPEIVLVEVTRRWAGQSPILRSESCSSAARDSTWASTSYLARSPSRRPWTRSHHRSSPPT